MLFSHSLVGIIGCFQNRGAPKWMVYNGQPHWNAWFGSETSIYSFPMFHPPLPMRPDSRFCRRCGTARPDPFLPVGDSQGNLRGTPWTPKLTTSNGIPQKSGRWFSCFFPHHKEVPRVPCFWKMLYITKKETKSSHDQFCRDFLAIKTTKQTKLSTFDWICCLVRWSHWPVDVERLEPSTRSPPCCWDQIFLIPSRSGVNFKDLLFSPWTLAKWSKLTSIPFKIGGKHQLAMNCWDGKWCILHVLTAWDWCLLPFGTFPDIELHCFSQRCRNAVLCTKSRTWPLWLWFFCHKYWHQFVWPILHRLQYRPTQPLHFTLASQISQGNS